MTPITPDSTTLRTGLTTGTCAAAAAAAAARLLVGAAVPAQVAVRLPGGSEATVPILDCGTTAGGEAWAKVRKDAGDDPDVTHGAEINVQLGWLASGDVEFVAGEGVGTVTKPGLPVPPGEPAINPVPRRQIREAIRAVTSRPVRVEVRVPGGRELAQKTFNPRLGVEGGISILGTSGIVRPFSDQAIRDTLVCMLNVAVAARVRRPVFVPGHIGRRAAEAGFRLSAEQTIEVSNEWGFMLERLAERPLEALLVVGHPGKLGKLAAGEWDTHSARSGSVLPALQRLVTTVGGVPVPPPPAGVPAPPPPTAEGLFRQLPAAVRRAVADRLAEQIAAAVRARLGGRVPVAVRLVDYEGATLGEWGDLTPWQQ